MAAYIDNRQYAAPINAVSGSFNFPPNSKRSEPISTDLDSSSEDENKGNEWKDLIRKVNSESECWIERNASKLRIPGKHYYDWESPISRLMHHGFITPIPFHFVRNHGPVPDALWHDWTVEICGLVKRPTKLTMDQVRDKHQERDCHGSDPRHHPRLYAKRRALGSRLRAPVENSHTGFHCWPNGQMAQANHCNSTRIDQPLPLHEQQSASHARGCRVGQR